MGEVRVYNFSQVQREFKPTITRGKWVLNGKNNEGYSYVIDRYKNSPTNSAIIDSYAKFIYGRGLKSNYNASNASQWASILSILPQKELRKICFDYAIFEEASLEIILTKDKKEIAQINHLPKNKVVPNEVNEKGEIESYWYCYDWTQTNKYKPEPIPVYTKDTKEARTILVLKTYSVDEFYFSRPSYFSGLRYAELEEEIAVYCVNHIKNGLSAGHIINVNEAITEDEVKDAFENAVKRKWSGSDNAGRFILSFNSSKDNATTIESVEVSNAHEQYQFLTEEARKQLMVAHKVTSPILFGIKDNVGLGNNANEMQTAFDELMLNVIQPKQDVILDGLTELFTRNGITIEIYFEALRPKQEVQQIQQQNMHAFCAHDTVADQLINLGEDEDLENYDLVAECEVDYEVDVNLASTGTARPNAKSEQDSADYLVRYQYAPLKVSENSREFCKKMVNAKKIYRKEDIIAMESQSVNKGWGPNGADTYSIWLYKGGGDCHHKWFRKIYVKKGIEVDVNSPLADLISTTNARKNGFNPPANDTLVSVAPKDMENNGFLNPR